VLDLAVVAEGIEQPAQLDEIPELLARYHATATATAVRATW